MNKISCVIVFRLGYAPFLQRLAPAKMIFRSVYRVPVTLIRFKEFSSQCRDRSEDASLKPSYMTIRETLSAEERIALGKDMVVLENFLSEEEEKKIFDEVEPYMSRLHYEFDHWDNVSYSRMFF